jgi:uncharacterized protein YegL
MGLDDVEFAENQEPRCPVLLLVDTSSSMSGEKIRELNQGLVTFQEDVSRDAKASKRVEIAIATFGGTVSLCQDFVTVDDFHPFALSTSGDTPMGQGIEYSLTLIEQRKQTYRNHGIQFSRPWLFLIADGEPTDSCDSAAQKIHQAIREKKLTFYAVGVGQANMDTLRQLSIERPPTLLKDTSFTEIFVWLSSSMSSVSSSSIGDNVILPSISRWGISNIQTLIENIYENGYGKRFNPRIYKKLGIKVDEREWIETISKMMKQGQVKEMLELTCPNCHEIIDNYVRYQDIPLDQTIGCIHCAHEFKVSEEHIIPMYSFSDNFDLMQEFSMPEKYSGILAEKN